MAGAERMDSTRMFHPQPHGAALRVRTTRIIGKDWRSSEAVFGFSGCSPWLAL
jgi:hypothetical protein